jgi:hypothetical protein
VHGIVERIDRGRRIGALTLTQVNIGFVNMRPATTFRGKIIAIAAGGKKKNGDYGRAKEASTEGNIHVILPT